MDKVRVRFVAFLLVFVLVLTVVVRSEGNRKFLETFFGSRVSWISQDDLDHETVEQIWIHCWKNIDSSSKTIPEFRLNHPYEIEKAIDDLPLITQRSLLDCLTERNIFLAKPNTKPVSTTWLERFFNIFFDFSGVPRRQLNSRHRTRHRRKPKNSNKNHQQRGDKPQATNLDKKNLHHRHESQAANLNKKNLHHRHESQAANLNKKRLPQTSTLPFHEKPSSRPRHKPQTTNVPLREKHPQHPKPRNTNLPLRRNRPDQQKKPENATLPLRKKHPKYEQHKPQTNTLAIHKLPRHHPIDKRTQKPNISPLGISSSLALAPSRTPTPAPAPAPIHISPKPYTPAPSPGPIPPSLDTLAPPLLTKPSPVGVSPLASPVRSEDDTRRYAFLVGTAVGSAVAVLAIMALLFFCCLKRVANKDGLKDENPLLNICLSRSIEDSGEKTQGESYSKEKIVNTTILIDHPTSNNETSSPYKSTETTQTSNNVSVPPPPGKNEQPPPSAPPPPPPKKASAPPPPPPEGGVKPPPPPLGKPLPRQRGTSSLGGSGDSNGGSDSHKAKLKPFFWDKVSTDQSMVWQELKAGSFQVNEEMMETLFGYTVAEKSINDERKGSSPTQYIQIIDPKKSQNLSILLKALNVTTNEVCDSLMEGNELPGEFIQALLKMAPTSEEELKLRLYNGELSLLGPAERFLKSVVEIPFAFKRIESLLFISSVQEEVSSINDAFKMLEMACRELKNSRLFLKLLEAVLKTGNRMNDGTYRGDAQAFKLDTLLKLSDVKGTDGKTTLLHFVVQEIIRSEGVRAARTLRESQSLSSLSDELNDISSPDNSDYYRNLGLEVLLGLSNDLENVRKSAVIDGDGVSNTVYKLGHSLGKIKNFLENEIEGLEGESEFRKKVQNFVKNTEDEIKRLVEEEKRIMDLVKGTVEYFYGKGAKNEGLRLFVIVRDFLVILEKVCKEVRSVEKAPVRAQRREAMTPSTSSDSIDIRQQRLFPAITANRRDDSSSDDDSF